MRWLRIGSPWHLATRFLLTVSPAAAVSVLLAVAALALLSASTPRTAHAAYAGKTVTITVRDFEFIDDKTGTNHTIAYVGDQVIWNNVQGTHDLCSGNGCSPPTTPPNTVQPFFDGTTHGSNPNPTVGPNGGWGVWPFTTPGTYHYECEVYPQMQGDLEILPAPASVGGVAELPDIAGSTSGGSARSMTLVALAAAAMFAAMAGALAWRRHRAVIADGWDEDVR